MNELLKQHCVPLHGQPPMDPAQIQQHLTEVPGWACVDAALEKTFSFKNYYETIAFLNAVAYICHRQDHHPELRVFYNRCVVRFDTHSVGETRESPFVSAVMNRVRISS